MTQSVVRYLDLAIEVYREPLVATLCNATRLFLQAALEPSPPPAHFLTATAQLALSIITLALEVYDG
jgi:hypothetical protein